MADIAIPWGDSELAVKLPPEWTVVQTARPSIPRAGEDWPDRLADALAKPEGLPPLAKMLAARPSGRIVLVVEDLTRHSPLRVVLPLVFKELDHARVPRENVLLLFATGLHQPLTPAQVAEKIGPELAGGVAWRSNPFADPKAYVDLGRVAVAGGGSFDVRVDAAVVRADLRILVSSVTPHLQAGFGGGHKMLVPGCAALETVRQLHLACVPRRPAQQIGQGHAANRMRQLIDAAGAAIDRAGGASFGVQYVLDERDQLSGIAAGDVLSCQRLLAKTAATGYGVVVEAPADVVIASSYPRDFDLWQSLKAVMNSSWAVRNNGVLICLTRCPAGANGMVTPDVPVSQRFVRRVLRLTGADALASLLTRLVPNLGGERAFFVRLALQVLRRHSVLLASPHLAEEGVKMIGMPIHPDAESACLAADAMLGEGPKRVILFPAGGVTYPVMRRQA